jgi:tetratricopeptide (TPR) repeat protein
MRRSALVMMVLVAATALPLSARFAMRETEDVPVDRIVANLSRQIALSPDNASLHASLARVHAIAYAQQVDTLPAVKGTADPSFTPWSGPPGVSPGAAASTAAGLDHLRKAVEEYKEAVRLSPHDYLVRLGYAWVLDQAGDRAGAIREYRAVVEGAWPDERSLKFVGPGRDPLTAEAVDYLEKLLDPTKDAEELARIRAQREQLKRLPRAVTPIAIPLSDQSVPSGIVDPRAAVAFDADGSGRLQRWTWISRDAAWLVHDPRGTGRIQSALQLFGSVTFWMFWQNGYAALAALDDDGDGELAGRELDGLALWNDRNGNGISDPGETLPLAAYGIVALSCRPVLLPDSPSLAAFVPDGVRYADGHTRPSYDVILREAPESTTRTRPGS